MSRLRREPWAWALALLVLAAPHGGRADEPLPPGVEGELLRADQLRQRALVDADLPALERLLGDELRFVHSNGRADTKATLLGALASGGLDYLSSRGSEFVARAYGDAGVVSGSVVLEVRAAGGPSRELHSLVTAVYVRRDGAWRLVAYQSTRAEVASGG